MDGYYKNAQQAFEDLYGEVNTYGIETGNGTRALHNIGVYIHKPLDREIKTDFRKWNPKYAEREWLWYLSGNRSVSEIKKHAPLWDKMHSGDDLVNSNYGWQWNRNDQLRKTIQQLKDNPLTRQAWISLHDGKEKDEYYHDTPCTLSVGFQIIDNTLCMNVHMRSNDLWYGFCNDQYCFSKLQELVAGELDLPVGWYYHFVANLHIYEQHYDKTRAFARR